MFRNTNSYEGNYSDVMAQNENATRTRPPELELTYRDVSSLTNSLSEEDSTEANTNRYNLVGARRSTVFAEIYNPEEDDSIDEIVWPAKEAVEIERLKNKIKKVVLFQNLSKDQMDKVIEIFVLKPVSKGEIIIKQGEVGNTFYVVDSGSFEVFINNSCGLKILIDTFENDGVFGEVSLLHDYPSAVRVEAKTDGALWFIERQTFRRNTLRCAYKKRKQYEEYIKNVEMFKSLKDEERIRLSDSIMTKEYEQNQIITGQGDKADGMFFIEKGGVIIKKTIGEEQDIVCRLGEGSYFGEMSMISNTRRLASAYAESKTTLAFIDVDTFDRLFGSCHSILLRDIKHFKDFNAKMNDKPSVI